jgi:hypothetical protein
MAIIQTRLMVQPPGNYFPPATSARSKGNISVPKPTGLQEGAAMDRIEIDGATLARSIREQTALPVSDAEAEALARALETSKDGDELLANTVAAVRFLVEELEQSTPDALNGTDRIG